MASGTVLMVRLRLAQMASKSGTGAARRLPRRSTPDCVNDLKAFDLIFTVFFL
jgi:hypothetical protein